MKNRINQKKSKFIKFDSDRTPMYPYTRAHTYLSTHTCIHAHIRKYLPWLGVTEGSLT